MTTSRREMTACASALPAQMPDCIISRHSRRVSLDMADNVGSLSPGEEFRKGSVASREPFSAVTPTPDRAVNGFNPDYVMRDPPVAPEPAPSGSPITNSQQPYCRDSQEHSVTDRRE